MSGERRERVDALCLEALSKIGSDRDAFLEQACGGDAGLRREVERLLAGQARADGFLERPAWAGEMPLAPGTRLGPYEITASLGAGGMRGSAAAVRAGSAGGGRAAPPQHPDGP